ncbi:MAG: ribosome small subunit-dependent GTPase A [Verrucomicrobia bacterium]|nr:ribosome small subunit-dependent GTPase A [Verrucomicrobiota bacterium]MBS0637396.1 ribosome small subunit-dependent GTPase A [Verrucomicrobiota bacterium]
MKDFIHHEESDYFDTSKDARQERKMAKKRDRSQYKKTDQDKLLKKEFVEPEEHLKKGIVTTVRPELFMVESEGTLYSCVLRGVLKKDKTKLKNLVIVGDIVYFAETGPETGAIASVEPRKSVLSRADHLSQQREHLIAANVDQVFITVSVIDPPLRIAIADRYLIAAEKGGLKPIIVCNKIDLLDSPEYPEREQEREMLNECKDVYEDLGITFLEVSAETGEGIDKLKALMKDRISVFSGQSGSGKSSLINAATGLTLKVGKTVAATRKGAHTTSSAQLLPLSFGGWCIDTPGIKSFGVWDLKEQDLRSYFDEIHAESQHCKFPDCRHDNDPGCAIPNAIEEGRISLLRYQSYLSLLASLQSKHLRR